MKIKDLEEIKNIIDNCSKEQLVMIIILICYNLLENNQKNELLTCITISMGLSELKKI
ncbi:MAG: hypothetical protein Q4E75_05050 [bacterium]|nr:hypothetical protein [bacterium]